MHGKILYKKISNLVQSTYLIFKLIILI